MSDQKNKQMQFVYEVNMYTCTEGGGEGKGSKRFSTCKVRGEIFPEKMNAPRRNEMTSTCAKEDNIKCHANNIK